MDAVQQTSHQENDIDGNYFIRVIILNVLLNEYLIYFQVVYKHVNETAQNPRLSRLFAVVMIGGSQFKVTTEDVIVVRNHFYPTIGDKIRLEKVIYFLTISNMF